MVMRRELAVLYIVQAMYTLTHPNFSFIIILMTFMNTRQCKSLILPMLPLERNSTILTNRLKT